MDSNPFENLSDEEILRAVREATRDSAAPNPAKPKEKVRFTLGGETIEADTIEEANRIAQEKFAEAIRNASAKPEPQPQPQGALPAKVEFDMKTFTDKFVNDPDAGLDYLETAKYGMPVRKAVPSLLGAVLALGAKVQELESASFAPKEAAERLAVEQVMRERNWQPSRQSYEDALLIAKGRGLLKEKEKEAKGGIADPAPPPATFIPPRTPRGTGEESLDVTNEELIRAAEDMPLEKLEDILIRSGFFSGNRAA